MLTSSPQIAKAVHEEVVTRDLVPAFVKLLKDNEAEVRTAIAGQIPRTYNQCFTLDNINLTVSTGFCAHLDRDTILNEVMTSIEDLVSDQSQHVRSALATQVSELAPLLGKEEYVHIFTIFCVAWCMELTVFKSGRPPIFCQCSCKCSKMSIPKFACTLFRNLIS